MKYDTFMGTGCIENMKSVKSPIQNNQPRCNQEQWPLTQNSLGEICAVLMHYIQDTPTKARLSFIPASIVLRESERGKTRTGRVFGLQIGERAPSRWLVVNKIGSSPPNKRP